MQTIRHLLKYDKSRYLKKYLNEIFLLETQVSENQKVNEYMNPWKRKLVSMNKISTEKVK